jgi:hypothetical protein
VDRFIKITLRKRQYNVKKEVLFFVLSKLSNQKIEENNFLKVNDLLNKYKLMKKHVLEDLSKL